MKEVPLNSKTPRWFQDWHIQHYKPLKDRQATDRKLIYIILAAILGATALDNGNVLALVDVVRSLSGG